MSSVYHGEPGWSKGASHATYATPKRPSTGTQKGHTPLLTDAQILEMRALDEFEGWSTKRLQLRFGVDADMVRRVLQGVTRAKLVPTRKHLPKDLEAA